MPFDEFLAQRVRSALEPMKADFTEKKMFGGLTFLYHGKMSVGVMQDELYVRVVSEKYLDVLAEPHCREMKFTGKAMKDFVIVKPEGFKSEAMLMRWINMGIDHAKRAQK